MPRRTFPPVVAARRAVQAVALGWAVVTGLRFAVWAFAGMEGRAPWASRPPGVEGFLPISALMSLRLWLAGDGVHQVHPAGLAILLGVVVMSAMVAKSFCSHLCPVGTVSEALGRLGARLLGRTWAPPRWLDVPLRSAKYLLLAFFLWATWVALDLAGVRAFLDGPYNRLADAKMLLFFARPSRLTIAVLGVLIVGSLLVRDLWCRYLCPYGALLGLVGRLAPLRVTRDAARCTACRACTQACPARLEVHTLARVGSPECSSCQDCVAVCPVAGCLAVRPPRRAAVGTWLRPAVAVGLAVCACLAVTLAFRLTGHWRGAVSEDEYARRLREIDAPIYTHVEELDSTPRRRGDLPPQRDLDER
jgi:polyferredoxin